MAKANSTSSPSRVYVVGFALTMAALFYILADTLTEKLVNQGDQATAFSVTTDQG